MKDKKYILITKDLHNSLIEFLDEIQFDIAGNTDKDSMHKVNFISWAVGELVNSFEAYFPKKKSREDYVCLLYTSPSPRDRQKSRMPSSA